MRILHINCNYVATTLHQLLVRNLEKMGIYSDVFVPIHSGIRAVIECDQNVRVVKCFNVRDRFLYRKKQKKIYEALQREYEVKNWNCIHAHTLFSDGGIAWRIKNDYGIPYIVAVRNTDVNVFFKYRVYLRKHGIEILKSAEAIVFLSLSYRDEVYQKYVDPLDVEELKNKTFIIPNGIDSFWLKNIPNIKRDDDGIIRCIYAGAINKNKNILTTLQACEILNNRGYRIQFTVVGKIEDNNIFNKIKKQKFVTYIPPQPKEKLIGLYRENDIFVMPSYTETFGLVYAEALSQGLPVIYSCGQGFDGQFPNGEVGYSVNSSDSKQIADSIIELMEKKNQISLRCIEKSKKFDWEKISSMYTAIYKRLGER